MKLMNMKRTLLLAAIAITSFTQSLAQNTANAVWVRAEATPVDGGLVYVNWMLEGDEIAEEYYSEFKRAINIGASTAFILAEPADGWQLAGYVRDNGDNQYENGEDQQIYVRPDGYFTAVYDPTEYQGDGSSSSSAQYEAEAALEDMENPTDMIFAVFTKGDIAMQAEDEEWMGKVWASKLNNEAGDEVYFSANGESISQNFGGVKYYKFDYWTTPDGNTVYDRYIKVTVTGGEIYYAHLTQTTQSDYLANERKNPTFSGISTLVNSTKAVDRSFYDLQGRRVATPTKGVFIQNGKKVVVK